MTIFTRSQSLSVNKTNQENEENKRVQIKQELNVERKKLMKKNKKQNILLSKITLELSKMELEIQKEGIELIEIEDVVKVNIELEVNIDFDEASIAFMKNKRSLGNGQFKYDSENSSVLTMS